MLSYVKVFIWLPHDSEGNGSTIIHGAKDEKDKYKLYPMKDCNNKKINNSCLSIFLSRITYKGEIAIKYKTKKVNNKIINGILTLQDIEEINKDNKNAKMAFLKICDAIKNNRLEDIQDPDKVILLNTLKSMGHLDGRSVGHVSLLIVHDNQEEYISFYPDYEEGCPVNLIGTYSCKGFMNNFYNDTQGEELWPDSIITLYDLNFDVMLKKCQGIKSKIENKKILWCTDVNIDHKEGINYKYQNCSSIVWFLLEEGGIMKKKPRIGGPRDIQLRKYLNCDKGSIFWGIFDNFFWRKWIVGPPLILHLVASAKENDMKKRIGYEKISHGLCTDTPINTKLVKYPGLKTVGKFIKNIDRSSMSEAFLYELANTLDKNATTGANIYWRQSMHLKKINPTYTKQSLGNFKMGKRLSYLHFNINLNISNEQINLNKYTSKKLHGVSINTALISEHPLKVNLTCVIVQGHMRVLERITKKGKVSNLPFLLIKTGDSICCFTGVKVNKNQLINAIPFCGGLLLSYKDNKTYIVNLAKKSMSFLMRDHIDKFSLIGAIKQPDLLIKTTNKIMIIKIDNDQLKIEEELLKKLNEIKDKIDNDRNYYTERQEKIDTYAKKKNDDTGNYSYLAIGGGVIAGILILGYLVLSQNDLPHGRIDGIVVIN